MKGKPKLEAAFAMIREAFTEAVSEAEKGAVAAWLANQALQHGSIKGGIRQGASNSTAELQRAPKGVARQLVEKALRRAGKEGVSPSAIEEYAETPEERKVSYSAIRLELNRGVKDRPRRYYNEGGRWYQA